MKDFVSRREVAAVVAVVADRFAGSDGMPLTEARALLSHWFTADEVTTILALITGRRIRCRRCMRCVSANGSQSSGQHCNACARVINEEGATP